MSANSRLTVAVHSLCWLELARRQGRPAQTSAMVAGSLVTNPVVVRRILGTLRDQGLVVAERGRGAGWSLARRSDEITLRDVNLALSDEGPFALHHNQPNPTCLVGQGLGPVLRSVFDDVEAAMDEVLARKTIADVLADSLRTAAAAGRTDGLRYLRLDALS